METAPKITLPLSVFISYAPVPKDEALRQELEAHLSLLKNLGLITTWHHRKTLAGSNLRQELSEHLETATLILLLISADFLASEECYKEMQVALERNKAGEALVIPIILRKVHLENAPFRHLQCLPRDGRPVRSWKDTDEAFTTIVDGIRETIEKYLTHQNIRISDKEKRLRALIPDHNGFLKDRLESFVGRQQELVEIQERINQRLPTGGYITITGQAGQGKSSSIAKLVEISGVEHVAYHFIPLNPGPDHQVGLLRNLMARLILKYDLSDLYVASDNRAALRDYFPKVLTEVVKQGGQEVIFIDGLDQLEEDFNGVRDLSFLPTNPPSGIIFVLGTRPNDTMKPLELLKPHEEYLLPNLSRQDFNLILEHRQVSLEKHLTDQFYLMMEENALYLDLVARELFDNKALSPLQVITQIASNPANIFSLSMTRLKRSPMEWREVIKPVLGLLLVTQEPLSYWHIRQILQVDDERLRDALIRLGGLITDDGQRHFTLFHLKLRDYLRQDEKGVHEECVFATDEEEGWHARVAIWCKQGHLSQIWQDVNNLSEQERRIYARQHYITHLYYAREWQQLFGVLDEGNYGHAKMRFDPSMRSYVQDLDRGRQAAACSGATLEDTIMMLPNLWRYTLLRGSLRSRANQYPQETFRLLLLIDREAEMLGLAELLTDPLYKVRVLLLMAEYFAKQPGRETESVQIFFRASEVARTIEDSHQRAEASRALAVSLAQVKQWEQAEMIARTIEDSHQRAEASRALAVSLAQAKQWEQAETIARTIEDSYQQVLALSELASILAQVEQWEEAKRFWAEAEMVARIIKEKPQQVLALSKLASSLAQVEQWEEAKRLWTEAEMVARIIKEKLQLAYELRVLASSLTHAKQWEEAKRLWAEAETVARAIEESPERSEALRALTSSLAQAKQWEQAETIARTIKENSQRARALRALVSSLAQAKQWEQAEAIARTIEDSHQRSEALRDLASSLAQIKQWEQAEAIARTIKESPQRARALSDLASSLAENRQKERAKTIYAEIERIVRLIKEEFPLRVVVLIELVSSLAQAKQWEQAETIACTIEEDHWQTRALSELASSLAQAKQWERAKRLWTEAETVARAIEGSYWQAIALRDLASSLAHAEQWEQAEMVARTIDEGYQRSEALRVLANSLVHAGQWEQAKQFWNEVETIARTIEGNSQRAEALRALAVSLAQVKQWEQAETIARTIEEDHQRAMALSELASSLAQTELWEQAETIARTIEEKGQRARALSGLASSLAQIKQWEQAEQFWTEVKTIAHTIQEGYQRSEVLRDLASSLAQAKQWEQAETIARTIKGSSQQAEILHMLTTCLFNAYEYKRLVHVIQSSWLEVETKNEALLSFSLALGFISIQPEMGDAFYCGLQWVEAFLNG